MPPISPSLVSPPPPCRRGGGVLVLCSLLNAVSRKGDSLPLGGLKSCLVIVTTLFVVVVVVGGGGDFLTGDKGTVET
jgi:hypothetical protein